MFRWRGRLTRIDTHHVPDSPRDTPCKRCMENVFNKEWHDEIARSADEKKWDAHFSRNFKASEVYDGMLEGCRWCCVVGNSLLTAGKYGMESYKVKDLPKYVPWYGKEGMPSCKMYTPDYLQAMDGTAIDISERTGDFTLLSLNCDTEVSTVLEFTKSHYSVGFDFVKIKIIKAIPTKSCPEPWILITESDIVTVLLEVMSNRGTVFARDWKVLSAAGDMWESATRTWVDACVHHHGCSTDTGFRPTRLIDLEGTNGPHLAESTEKTKAEQYVALSYVWGLQQKYILTQDTMQEMLVGLNLNKVPQSILDAFKVTNKLGFRYIWIDALCIIQDSVRDKTKELPMMADIYQNSVLTISAASASAVQAGFLTSPRTHAFIVEPFKMGLGDYNGGFPETKLTFGVRNDDFDDEQVDPIHDRGWTLQEWHLSPRRLIFSIHGIQWNCNKLTIDPATLSGFENDLPGGAREIYTPETISDGFTSHPEEKPHVLTQTHKQMELSWLWNTVRSQYAGRALTNPLDKLPAISALASTAAKGSGMKYLAGLWKESLTTDLQWRCLIPAGQSNNAATMTVDPRLDKSYVAPSWSWASLKYPGWLKPSNVKEENSDPVWNFRVVDCAVELANGSNFEFGAVKSGYLDVDGRALDTTWEPSTNQTRLSNAVSLYDVPRRPDNARLGAGFLDCPTHGLDQSIPLLCLVVTRANWTDMFANARNERRGPHTGLLLLDLGDEIAAGGIKRRVYRRVGRCRLFEPSLSDQTTSRSLRII